MSIPRQKTYSLRALRCFFFAAACFAVLLTGCAPGFRLAHPLATHNLESEKPGWWYASFRIRWNQDEEPLWYIDSMIAHKVAAPVLEEFKKEILLWRFHRRAAPDASGHRFTLIVYSPPDVARRAFGAMDSSIVLEELKTTGVVLKVSYDDTKKIAKPHVEDTSDQAWSKPLQRSWPWFIMGVSETWLDLIEQYANDGRPKPLTIDEMMEFYKGVDKSVTEAWTKEGSHAFLHHLNALFGYKPVTVQGKYPVRF